MSLFEEEVLETEQSQGAHDDHDVLGVHEHSKHVQRSRGGWPRHGQRFGAEDDLSPVLQKDAHADGADHDGQEAPVAQGIVGDTLEDDAEDTHEDDGDHAGQDEGDIQAGHQPHGYKGRDHRELPLREIDDVDRIEDQDEPQGNQGVN